MSGPNLQHLRQAALVRLPTHQVVELPPMSMIIRGWGVLTASFASGGKRLRQSWVDGVYEVQWLRDWVRSVKQTHKIDLELVERTGKGFEVIKQRWKVEQTLA